MPPGFVEPLHDLVHCETCEDKWEEWVKRVKRVRCDDIDGILMVILAPGAQHAQTSTCVSMTIGLRGMNKTGFWFVI